MRRLNFLMNVRPYPHDTDTIGEAVEKVLKVINPSGYHRAWVEPRSSTLLEVWVDTTIEEDDG